MEQEQRLSTVDTSQPFIDSQFGEIKFQSVVFRQFKAWLGEGANFRTMERIVKGKIEKQPQTTEKTKPTDPFIEFEKKNSNPKGRR